MLLLKNLCFPGIFLFYQNDTYNLFRSNVLKISYAISDCYFSNLELDSSFTF